MSAVLDLIAALLIVISLANTYFLWHGWLIYRRVHPRSPVLLALLGVKAAVWVVGGYVGNAAVRVLFDLSPLPLNGILLGVAVLVLFLTPAFIHLQMRRFLEVSDDS